jgi:Flp pilus assembly protein TadG
LEALEERIDVAASWKNNLVNSRTRSGESGQALMEFAIIASVMIILALGVIDFGRAIYDKEVLSDLSRTGSNLASRGSCGGTVSLCLSTAANAVITEPSDLNMVANGLVIVTSVTNYKGVTTITGQYSQGNGSLGSSKIGSAVGGPANLPVTVPPIPPANQTIYVTEVFYPFAPITPIGKFMTIVFPATLYDVAYF